MPIPREERDAYFLSKAKELIDKHNITKSYKSDYVSAQRIGHIFSEVMVKIYGINLNQDSLICFRDWARDSKLLCDELREVEYRSGKKTASPFYSATTRCYPHLSFEKYFKIILKILQPPRSPITCRTPVRKFQ